MPSLCTLSELDSKHNSNAQHEVDKHVRTFMKPRHRRRRGLDRTTT